MKKLFILLLFLLTSSAYAQHTFKFILSTGPGSGSDLAIETFQTCFKSQNINVIKDFKPGAEGLIAMKAMMSSDNTKDITHVLVGNFGLNMLSKFPGIDLLEDIHPITYMFQTALVLNSRPGHVDNMEQLIQLSKTRPITVGTSVIGATWLMNQLFTNLKIPFVHVPYKNNVNSLVDVANGSLDIAIDTMLASKQFSESQKIKIILASLDNKKAQYYNVTSIEKYSQYLATIPFGVVLSVTPGTTKQNKDLVQDVIINCNKDKEIIQKLDRMGANPVTMTIDETRKIVKSVITNK